MYKTYYSAREISNYLFSRGGANSLDTGHSDLRSEFGQFLAHDITLSKQGNEREDISVPKGDPFFDPDSTGNVKIPFRRTIYNTDKDGVRQQINSHSSFIDGSNLYGSEPEREKKLRAEFGFLKNSTNIKGEEMLPFNTFGLPNDNNAKKQPDEELYVSGDIRVNENPAITCITTIFLREHNRIAANFNQMYPYWSDEKIYQETKKRVIALMQSITFNEYAPQVLGSALPVYIRYNDKIDPTIDNFFAAAAFRYGHSAINSVFVRVNEQRIVESPLLLRDIYFYPKAWADDGCDSIIRGQAIQKIQNIDTAYVDDLRNWLFGAPGRGGLDLASLNIQRGRDHGLLTYNDARKSFGLKPAKNWEDLTKDQELIKLLKQIYGSVELIDSYVGGLAEESINNTGIGELFIHSIRDQYIRLRDGDRFYYLNDDSLSQEEKQNITNTKFSDVILRNSGILSMPCNVFTVSSDLNCGEPSSYNGRSGTNTATFLDGSYTLLWQFEDDETILITISVSASGWVGFGFASQAGQMVGSDAIISIVSGGSVTVTDYRITSRAVGCPGVCDEETQDAFLVSGSEVGGVTTVTWRRKLSTGDSNDIAILDNGVATNVVFAFSSSDSLGYHGGTRGSASINFFTNSVIDSFDTDKQYHLLIHGIIMFLAWGVLVAFGIAIVRIGPKISFLRPFYFPIHVIVMYIALLMMLAGLTISVQAVTKGQHFNEPYQVHKCLGLFIVVSGAFVSGIGMIAFILQAAKKAGTIIGDIILRSHAILGYCITIISFVTLFYGLDAKPDTSTAIWILMSIWIGFVAAIIIICATYYLYEMFSIYIGGSKKSTKSKAVPETGGADFD
eukprot:TRINITY_DN6906_c0_g1_i1.p1 TRINITY_DN6906_c0_g1~~TRINITY_DN6906_c0_g1_i1.p1  ORF type:complete len:905 (-),score=345.12 TRINITY_DN6906_c0_g1_i1:55-2586(-)